jgi:hypothetical protein
VIPCFALAGSLSGQASRVRPAPGRHVVSGPAAPGFSRPSRAVSDGCARSRIRNWCRSISGRSPDLKISPITSCLLPASANRSYQAYRPAPLKIWWAFPCPRQLRTPPPRIGPSPQRNPAIRNRSRTPAQPSQPPPPPPDTTKPRIPGRLTRRRSDMVVAPTPLWRHGSHNHVVDRNPAVLNRTGNRASIAGHACQHRQVRQHPRASPPLAALTSHPRRRASRRHASRRPQWRLREPGLNPGSPTRTRNGSLCARARHGWTATTGRIFPTAGTASTMRWPRIRLRTPTGPIRPSPRKGSSPPSRSTALTRPTRSTGSIPSSRC